MKKITLSLALILSLTVSAQQTKRTKIAQESEFSVNETITNNDTLVYYYFSYQNQKYTHITDIGSVLLNTKEQVLLLSDKLKEFSEITEKVTIEFKTREYTLAVYDFSNQIYLTDNKGKYTSISKNKALKLSNSMLIYVNYLKE